MKQTKKLTYNERKIVASWGLNPKEWRREKLVNGVLILRNTRTGEEYQCPAQEVLK